MPQSVTILNAVPTLNLEEVVIGSQLRISVLFERLVSQNPDTFEPIDFTGMVIKAEVKDNPSTEIEADAEFYCSARVDPGWVDFVLDGNSTGLLLQKKYYASVKTWPDGSPEQGETLLSIILPMKFKATR